MTEDEKIRIRCLELAVSQGEKMADDCIESARTYFAFVKERSGDNVIDAARSFQNRSNKP